MKNNVIMDLREIGWEGVDWIIVAHDEEKSVDYFRRSLAETKENNVNISTIK
jgi:hypothetical protein